MPTYTDVSNTYTNKSGTTGTLGGMTQSGTGAYGTVPTVSDPTSTQATAISGNASNLSNLFNLANRYDTFTTQQAELPYSMNLPNYSAMTQQSSDNILQNLQGIVNSDVVSQLSQSAAERGVSTGLGMGSDNSNTALLRALGLTSYSLQNTGESQLTSAMQRTPTGQQMNLSNFLVTPSDQQQAQTYANLYASYANPTEAAAANTSAAKGGVSYGQSSAGGGGGSSSSGSGSKSGSTSSGGSSGVSTANSNSGGVTYSNPTASAYDNWNNWYNSLFNTANTLGNGSLGTGLGDLDPSIINTEDWLWGLDNDWTY